MKIVALSGTPGVGKTTISRALSNRLGIPHIDLSEAVIGNRLYIEYDAERASFVIDEDRVREFIVSKYRELGPFILDSHYAEIAPREVLEVIFVIRLDPEKLIERLEAKGWNPKKIAENVEAELLSICTRNAIEEHGETMVIEIDATNKSVEEIVDEIIGILYGDRVAEYGQRIDWLSQLDERKLSKVVNYIETYR